MCQATEIRRHQESNKTRAKQPKVTGCLVRAFGGEIPRVPGAVIKNTCITIYIVLLGFSYRIFDST